MISRDEFRVNAHKAVENGKVTIHGAIDNPNMAIHNIIEDTRPNMSKLLLI